MGLATTCYVFKWVCCTLPFHIKSIETVLKNNRISAIESHSEICLLSDLQTIYRNLRKNILQLLHALRYKIFFQSYMKYQIIAQFIDMQFFASSLSRRLALRRYKPDNSAGTRCLLNFGSNSFTKKLCCCI